MNPAITVHDLRFHYPDGKEALRGISFAVGERECVGLVGPNGSGKSTLLLHLNGLLPEDLPSTPGVTICGRPVNRENASAIRRDVGLLFQDPDDQLFCPTVYEDVAFGPQQFGLSEEQLKAAVKKGLEVTSLLGYENRSPHHLSSGEKRRVCLAGVLACEPRVLALDEPTSNLDPRGKRSLIQTLKSIPATKIIATHDLEMVVELCSRTIVLDQGLIVADGPTKELLGDEQLMLAHGLEKPHVLRHTHPH
ncbi:MAG: ABC transporter ATP-binding protein [Ignavibacteriales bacterium]|nr:ABC transporter ATP-binding protein [Ignavibacteriales bacterium]